MCAYIYIEIVYYTYKFTSKSIKIFSCLRFLFDGFFGTKTARDSEMLSQGEGGPTIL